MERSTHTLLIGERESLNVRIRSLDIRRVSFYLSMPTTGVFPIDCLSFSTTNFCPN